MKNLRNALVGTMAVGAMAVSTATPALARDRDGGISAGEVIAGALIIGGIAAVAASSGKDRDRNRYRYGNDYRYDRAGYRNAGGSSRAAVQQCVRAAESTASRYSYGRANVTDIRRVNRKRNGYEVRGRIAVNERGQGWNRRGGYDTGNFKCDVRYGRIAGLDFSGIRGLR